MRRKKSRAAFVKARRKGSPRARKPEIRPVLAQIDLR